MATVNGEGGDGDGALLWGKPFDTVRPGRVFLRSEEVVQARVRVLVLLDVPVAFRVVRMIGRRVTTDLSDS